MNNKEYYRSKTWQIVIFALGQAAANMFLLLMNFSQYAAVGIYGIATVTVSLILTGTRIFDAVTDPICGFISDRVNTKYGRFRPLLLAGYLIMALSTLVMFFVGKGQGAAGILLFTILYMIYIIGYTITNVALKSSITLMTNDPRQRPLIGRFNSFYTLTLSTVFTVFLSKVLVPKYGGLNIDAIRALNIIAVVLSGIITLLVMYAISEKDTPENIQNLSASSTPALKDIIATVKGNRPLQMLIIAGATDKLAQQTSSNSSITIMLFGIIIGNYAFQGTLSLYAYIPNLIMIYLITRYARSLGSKKALISFSWGGIAVCIAILAFLLIIDPTTISRSTLPTVIFLVLYIIRIGVIQANSALTNVMVADCSDYEMYRTGKYMPGLTSTVFSFIDKLFSSLSTTIVGLTVATIGYTNSLPQIGDPYSAPLFWVCMILFLGLPALGWLCSVIALKYYDLTPEKMEEIQKYNRELREKAAANA